jgi:CRP-like cAMP-binding protein
MQLDTESNFLLRALPDEVRARLLPHLELVDLPLGKVIHDPGVEMKRVYFPLPGCIISMLCVMENGSSAEVAVVGKEGMLGLALFMDGGSTTSQAIVQSAGQAYQLNGAILKSEFERHADLENLLLHFTQALIEQMSQTAVCNRHHSIEQQLCRWLLLSLDRLPDNKLIMTQELIANMLGVRREGVTTAAGKLQNLGLIRYRRGQIEVLDRAGLEKQSCECYAVVRNEYERLQPESSSLRL